MLPSLLTREIRAGIERYLLQAYAPTDPFFEEILERFLQRPGAWLKGPYLQLGLPFLEGEKGKGFFADFETRHGGYLHQEQAWDRLAAGGEAANTLVATGTGSGKTECFLYPLLDHCAKEAEAGKRGVKALIIYPMNALAADQARRMAAMVAAVPHFNALRVGMYVGGEAPATGGTTMTADNVIFDRATLRNSPPDVLLTNFKMLDYLLVRPTDRQLWQANEPETLRYVVVDELHTFDGAQGTDLSLLLRRLKARLGSPDGHITHIGTSATLGSAADTEPLRRYAAEVFGSPFPEPSVITESRLEISDFLGPDRDDGAAVPGPADAALLDPSLYRCDTEAVAAWFRLFFPAEPQPGDVRDPHWRMELGRLLKRHPFFAGLVEAASGEAAPMATLYERLAHLAPGRGGTRLPAMVDAMLALAGWARSEKPAGAPLVTLRVQAWVRELRRMVAPLATSPSDVELMLEQELPGDRRRLYLPLIQCADCRATAYLGCLANIKDNRLMPDMNAIYGAWFRGAPEVVRLYPGARMKGAHVAVIGHSLCVECGRLLVPGATQCDGCGSSALLEVSRTVGEKPRPGSNGNQMRHDPACPVCGAADSMMLIGSRATTLAAQVVQESWASRYNDDRKMIAFSDSVQDAAHRAGFIGARTWTSTVRRAMARAIEYLAKDGAMPWDEFRRDLGNLWKDPSGPLTMDAPRFLAEFIAPNMTWQDDWEDLRKGGRAPNAGDPIIARVVKRLRWQAFAEFTYAGARGRTLERSAVATLAPNPDEIDVAATRMVDLLREEFDRRHDHAEVFQWLWGLVYHLRRIGAILEPEMRTYAESGDTYQLSKVRDRELWMPGIGKRAARPRFLASAEIPDFEHVTNRGGSTWYDRWLDATLGGGGLVMQGVGGDIYKAALDEMAELGVVRKVDGGKGTVLGLEPARLLLVRDLRCLLTDRGTRPMMAPTDVADRLVGMPCPDAPGERYASVTKPDPGPAAALMGGHLRRIVPAEHTGLLDREEREELERRFKASPGEPWYENLLSATPTLEMGVDIGDLSSVMLCSVPPTTSRFLQRVGRAGRRDGNSHAVTLADGASPHDLYFFEEPMEMIAGDVVPPGVFLKAPEVLRRQFMAYCLDCWVGGGVTEEEFPPKTGTALDVLDQANKKRFPLLFIDDLQTHRQDRLDGFIGVLGPVATAPVRERLKQFAEGDEDVTNLTSALLAALTDALTERSAHTARLKEIRARITALRKLPKDEATANEIDELELGKSKLLELIADINGKDVLGTLTDAGVLPNYAFPEAGVTLKSMIWRKATEQDRAGAKHVPMATVSVERPAASALGEFAPDNKFYAKQRQVQIDQVSMELSRPEEWRLCPTCHHSERVDLPGGDSHVDCPRCGDAMWADQAQKRTLLRFRQALATSEDAASRIDDRVEEREPMFYVRQMLVDFPISKIKEAWKLRSDEKAFGFEFIESATFRDVNFGESGRGEQFKVAGNEQGRPGFRVCRRCGKVQKAPTAEDRGPDKPAHARDCEAVRNPKDDDIVECLYLYREFNSEALRILIPFTRLGTDQDVVDSFSAAIQMGLKRQFGGQVDHLRVIHQDLPDPDGGPRRNYLLVYDSVPGGTGYLHQLLAEDAWALRDLFRKALAAMVDCPCASVLEKDGCYRCVYQYRLGRSMSRVSRRKAVELLSGIVDSLDTLERTDTIATITLNPEISSVLEFRLVEAIRRLDGKGELPPIKMVDEVVNGKHGYHLRVGTNHYSVEPQATMDGSCGVRRKSIPDFLIRPLDRSSVMKPVALFCDGWDPHRGLMREDAAKRTAIANSGRFQVWTVVSADVEAAILGEVNGNLPSPYALTRDSKRLAPWLAPGHEDLFDQNGVAALLYRLAAPVGSTDPWIAEAWDACMLWLLRSVPQPADGALEVRNKRLRDALPDWLPSVPADLWRESGMADGGRFDVAGVWCQAIHQPRALATPLPIVVLMDDGRPTENNQGRDEWRMWLRAFNWFQSIPGAILATEAGVAGHDYDALAPGTAASPGAGAGDGDWEDVISQSLESLADEARKVADAGCPPPDEVGYALVDAQGEEASMAEWAWTDHMLALLVDEYTADRAQWEAAGWRVVEAGDSWSVAVIHALGEGETNACK